ncbi:MAG: hypothetical protein AW10_01130 [Candidatus Accumulibacter appositus]|uniref:Uncharacterized protein n=1 Tax=Candidatus Accumulibacter appositus TaxID=1454003 RepID=A0A011NFY6_9PROT|nr:MAG: hypothetical protein AW10_01130 [Candidatus Accumulibacter appositus]
MFGAKRQPSIAALDWSSLQRAVMTVTAGSGLPCHDSWHGQRSNRVGMLAERSRSVVLLPNSRLRSGECE